MRREQPTDDKPVFDLPEPIVQEMNHQPIAHHDYIQRGTMIECQSCPYPHAEYIKPGYILGKDESGALVIRTVEEDEAARNK